MQLIEALKKSEAGEVRRKVSLTINIHLWTICRKPDGYGLSCQVFSIQEEFQRENTWDFRYLTDLFVTAKQQGFFHEIMPNASDWGVMPEVTNWQPIIEALDNYFPGEELYDYYATDNVIEQDDDDNEEVEDDKNFEDEYYYEDQPNKFTASEARGYYNTIY